MTDRPLHIISLGAGVQSSTMSLMAARGEITPMPDHAIFADTGAEPRKVYEWLDWLEKQLPFPVHRVIAGKGLRHDIVKMVRFRGTEHARRVALAPFYTETDDVGREGQLRRQCTKDYKITPIDRKTRELLGLKKGQRGPKHIAVVSWQGISLDEIQRARRGVEGWQDVRYPLIEKRMTRSDCLLWMERNGYPKPSKSSCTFCPYHDDGLWRDMKRNDPESWADAVAVDELIRDSGYTRHKMYVHRSLKPLAEIDFRNAADHGQLDAFADECQGMCGL